MNKDIKEKNHEYSIFMTFKKTILNHIVQGCKTKGNQEIDNHKSHKRITSEETEL